MVLRAVLLSLKPVPLIVVAGFSSVKRFEGIPEFDGIPGFDPLRELSPEEAGR